MSEAIVYAHEFRCIEMFIITVEIVARGVLACISRKAGGFRQGLIHKAVSSGQTFSVMSRHMAKGAAGSSP